MIVAPKFVAMQSTRPQNVFWIHWNLSKRCNYNCTYCPDFLHDFTSPHRSLDNLISIAEKIKKNVPSEKFIRIWFTGGEPTANPNFLTFCKYLKENGITHIGLNTNGSRSKEYHIELCKYVNKIQFSSHFEFMEDDKFLETLEDCPRKQISLNLMAEPEYWDRVKRLVGFCEQRQINYHLKRIRPKHNYEPPYTKEQISWLEEREHIQIYDDYGNRVDKPDVLTYKNINAEPEEMWSNDVVTKREDNFFGWICGVGLEGLEINADGTIHRGVCGVGGTLCHIDDTDWNLPKEFISCSKHRCSCVADLKNTRYKSHAVRKELSESVRFEIRKRKGSISAINI